MHGCIAYRIMCHLDHANHNARRLQGGWLGVGMAHHGCGGRRSRRPLGDGKDGAGWGLACMRLTLNQP